MNLTVDFSCSLLTCRNGQRETASSDFRVSSLQFGNDTPSEGGPELRSFVLRHSSMEQLCSLRPAAVEKHCSTTDGQYSVHCQILHCGASGIFFFRILSILCWFPWATWKFELKGLGSHELHYMEILAWFACPTRISCMGCPKSNRAMINSKNCLYTAIACLQHQYKNITTLEKKTFWNTPAFHSMFARYSFQ
jgi:hypothetical protein